MYKKPDKNWFGTIHPNEDKIKLTACHNLKNIRK